MVAAKTAPEERATPPIRRVSTTEMFTMVTADDPSWMGARPSDKHQDMLNRIMKGEAVEGASNAHAQATERARLRQVMIDFPMHIVHMLMGMGTPLLTGAVVILWSGYTARRLADRFPNALGAIAVLQEETAHMWDASDFLVNLVAVSYGRFVYYVLTIVVTFTLFNHNRFYKPLMRILIPAFFIHLSCPVLNKALQMDDGCSPISGLTTIIQACILLGVIIFSFRMLNRMVDPQNMYWGWGCVIVLGILLTAGTAYSMMWDTIVDSGDATKAIIGAVMNPLLYEIFLVMARVIVRMVPHAHESTVPHLVTVVMAQKKMFGRFIIGMISSNGLVTAASMVLGVAEVTFALTLGVRDKFVYTRCSSCNTDKSKDPLAAIKAKSLMRARNAHMETQLEIIFIVLMGFVVPLSYDLSGDGKHPDVGTLIGSVTVQLLIEICVDFIIVTWLTTKCKQPVMAVAHLSYRGSTFFLCVICFWACSFCTDLVLNEVVGTTGTTESTFIYYSKEMFANVTATGLAECD